MNPRALAAEALGAFTYVAAISATMLFLGPAGGPAAALATALAAGFSVAAMMFAVGYVSGGHFNPAVTLGLVAAGRFDMGEAIGYILAQVVGGIAAAFLLSLVLGGAVGGKWGTFGAVANTFGGVGQFSLLSTMLLEIVSAGLLLLVITGVTSRKAPAGFAPLAVGLTLVVLHLATAPVTNAGLNPARATASAVAAGGRALGDLWVFWVAPIIGGVAGGLLGSWLQQE